MSNLNLWKKVETTDPSHIQDANVSGQKRKTVKAVFQKEKATEVFGVQGQMWGAVVGSEEYTRVHIENGEILLQYTGVMFYVWDGVRGEIPMASAILERQLVKRNKPDEYLKLDHEAIKKVRTDAMTKALSELGFNADIFKGYYDSRGYSEYAADIVGEEIAEQQAKKVIDEAEKWKNETLPSMLVSYSELTTVKAVTTLNTEHTRKAQKIGDSHAIKLLAKAKDKKINELTESKEDV